MRRLRTATVLACAALAALPTGARAGAYDDLLRDFRKAGTLDGCAYSPDALADAQKALPNDIQQYAPKFPAALQAAASKRSSGACDAPAATQPDPAAAAAAPAAGTPQPTPAPAAAPAAADGAIPAAAATEDQGSGDAPAPVILLGLVGGVLLLGGLAWGAARWWAYEPPWLLRARHATAEAGWHTSAAWAEFRDWVRLGR
jgi:hypothetical protein